MRIRSIVVDQVDIDLLAKQRDQLNELLSREDVSDDNDLGGLLGFLEHITDKYGEQS